MNPEQVNMLLQSYIKSLQSTIVLAKGPQCAYTENLKQFVDKCCVGIEKSSKLRQRLLDDQIELFEKYKENDQSL